MRIRTQYYYSRKLKLAIALVLFIVGLCGCTRNNGDIGPWFGTWKLTEITIDGTPEASYGGNVFWKFQNDVFVMLRRNMNPNESSAENRYGTWSESNDYLFIDFTNYDDSNPPENGAAGEGIYAPFLETHFILGGVSQLKIVNQSGSEAYLMFTSPADGKTYGYRIRKQE